MQSTRISLLERLRVGRDPRSWEVFYGIYRRPILAYAAKLGLEADACQDVLQETMVALMRALPTFVYDPARGRFRNFLLTIVHRRTLAAFRRARCRPAPLADPSEVADHMDERTDPLQEAAEALWRESLVTEALRRLAASGAVSSETLAIFQAYVVEGVPVAEVSARFGLCANAVYQVRHRLLVQLRRLVRELEEGDLPPRKIPDSEAIQG